MQFTRTPAGMWADVQADALAWHDKGRKDWIGHSVVVGEVTAIVDRVEDKGDGWWRLHLIDCSTS